MYIDFRLKGTQYSGNESCMVLNPIQVYFNTNLTRDIVFLHRIQNLCAKATKYFKMKPENEFHISKKIEIMGPTCTICGR